MSNETPRDVLDQQESPTKKRHASEAQRLAGINNLKKFNASRNGKPALKHGLSSFINTGSAPSRAIEKQLDDFEAGLIADLGHTPSTAELCLIQSCRTALGVCLLTEQHVHQGIGKFSRNRWIWQVGATYGNTLRLNLRELGIDWRGKQAVTLGAELAEKRKRNSLESIIAATEEPTTLPDWYLRSKETHDVEDIGTSAKQQTQPPTHVDDGSLIEFPVKKDA